MKALCAAAVLLTFLNLSGQEKASYFQQEVNYRIQVELDDKLHLLQGQLELDYTNNAPSELNEILFHLWPNAYANVSTPLAAQLRETKDFQFQFSSAEEKGRIDSLSFSIDGQDISFSATDKSSEIVRLSLPHTLKSGESITIKTPFRVKIPSSAFSRLGHIQTSYQVTQWYPKPVVFDAKGWHPMPYLSQGEFFSEFGSFEVEITVPSNYVVGATGLIEESVQDELIAQSVESRNSQKGNNAFPASASSTKTLFYAQDDIHDFAWFADKRFNVLHDTIILPNSGRVIDAWVLYTESNPETWKKSMEYVKDGTRFYSQKVGEYPYDHVTVVDGTIAAGGGMEYPMITVVNSTGDDRELERVIVHEIGHNWFYGILGTNEREHAWMDEGINTFYEVRYFEEKYGRRRVGEKKGVFGAIPQNRDLMYLGYLLSAREHLDQGLHKCAHQYNSINYGVEVYAKAGLLMQYLRTVIGSDLFDEGMHTYFNQWKFKHPSPKAFQTSLEESFGQRLDWFFDGLIQGQKKLDFKVDSYDTSTDMIRIKSLSSFEGAVPVGFYFNDKLLGVRVIRSNQPTQVGLGEVDQIIIDPNGDVPEINRKNNFYRPHRTFKRGGGLHTSALTRSGIEGKRGIFINPMLTWNDHDRLMLGLNLTNYEGVKKEWEWTLAPMYSGSTNRVVGYANGRYTIWLNDLNPYPKVFKRRDIQMEVHRPPNF